MKKEMVLTSLVDFKRILPGTLQLQTSNSYYNCKLVYIYNDMAWTDKAINIIIYCLYGILILQIQKQGQKFDQILNF